MIGSKQSRLVTNVFYLTHTYLVTKRRPKVSLRGGFQYGYFAGIFIGAPLRSTLLFTFKIDEDVSIPKA